MTAFWITLLIAIPIAGVFLGWRLARTDRRINDIRDSVLRDIDIDREAGKDSDE